MTLTPRELQRRLEATGATRARLCQVAGYPASTLERWTKGLKVAHRDQVARDLSEALERIEREVGV